MIKVCLCRKKEFITNSEEAKFCNRSCSNKHRWADPNSSLNSLEVKEKRSESMKKIWADPNSKYSSPEYRNKISENSKKRMADPNSKFNSLECKKKQSNSMKRRWVDPNSTINSSECKHKKSESLKKAFSTPEHKERMRQHRLHQRMPRNGTSIERAIEGVLDELEVAYFSGLPFGRFQYDEFLPKYDILIECDGDYWHSLPKVIESDKKKNIIAKENGYLLLRFTGTEIRKDIEYCKDTIEYSIQEQKERIYSQ